MDLKAKFIMKHYKKLIENGDNVICLDNFFTGRHENIEKLKEKETFQLLEHDIIEPVDIECDEIYNLACPASPVHYQYEEKDY